MSRGDNTGRPPGSALPNVLLALASVTLVLALAYPTLRWMAFERRVHAAVRNVDAVRTAAERYHREHGAWPATSKAGVMPRELTGLLANDAMFDGPGYRLRWNRWRDVTQTTAPAAAKPPSDTVPPTHVVPRPPVRSESGSGARPPTTSAETLHASRFEVGTLAAITLDAPDPSLLAALLDHYGRRTSFARDSSWTLMITAPDSGSEGAVGSGRRAR